MKYFFILLFVFVLIGIVTGCQYLPDEFRDKCLTMSGEIVNCTDLETIEVIKDEKAL